MKTWFCPSPGHPPDGASSQILASHAQPAHPGAIAVTLTLRAVTESDDETDRVVIERRAGAGSAGERVRLREAAQ